MGKRNPGHERRENEFWPTPFAGVLPLIPFLKHERIKTFAEPCCGEGDLVRHLEILRAHLHLPGRSPTGQDALARSDYGQADATITNPPHDKPRIVMRNLIGHFTAIGPSWLLLPADFAMTRRAAPYQERCSDVVPIGRLIWLGEASPGFDNYAWYRYDPDHRGGPRLWAKGEVPSGRRATCAEPDCRKPFRPLRSDGRFCSDRCRQRAFRSQLAVT